MKILIVSYYELKDALLCVANALRELGYTVTNYPLFQMAYDVHSRRSDYAEHFAHHIRLEAPDIMVWWFTNIPASVIESLRTSALQVHPSMFWLWFNWDDPWMWFNKELEVDKKCAYFDCVAATSSAMLKKYEACGTKRAIFAMPGFDPNIHYPVAATPKRYDVSICCTNLYDNGTFTDQYVPRKQLIDDLVQTPGIEFALFGPQHLKASYPQHYRGLVSYSDTNCVFNESRIVLCTHVCHSYEHYMNERTVLALGAGSLLLVDAVKGMEDIVPRDCYVVLDRVNYIAQIQQLLASEPHDTIKRNGYEWALANATWTNTAKRLHEQIVTHFFDPVFYRETYAAADHLNNEELLQHCITAATPKLCCPERKKTPSSMNVVPFKIDFESWCRINAVLAHCQTPETLQEFQQIIDSNSNLDVNRILEAHFAMKEQFN